MSDKRNRSHGLYIFDNSAVATVAAANRDWLQRDHTPFAMRFGSIVVFVKRTHNPDPRPAKLCNRKAKNSGDSFQVSSVAASAAVRDAFVQAVISSSVPSATCGHKVSSTRLDKICDDRPKALVAV